jgi:hypothetical protein
MEGDGSFPSSPVFAEGALLGLRVRVAGFGGIFCGRALFGGGRRRGLSIVAGECVGDGRFVGHSFRVGGDV